MTIEIHNILDTVDYKIFDSHLHVGNWTYDLNQGNEITPFVRPIVNQETLFAYISNNSINKCVIVPHYTSSGIIELTTFNPLVLKLCKSNDNVYGGLWFTPLDIIDNYLEEIINNFQNSKIVAAGEPPISGLF
jgi:hypothetical protein